jgi:UDPglucose 6-dehydrogenase
VSEPDLGDYMEQVSVKKTLQGTSNASFAVANSDACLFVTPTPSLPDGAFDHTALLKAFAAIAVEVQRQHRRKYVFVVTSTVTPGFMGDQALPMLRRVFENEGPFCLAYKPEFIALGTVLNDLHNPDVVLVGASNEETGAGVEKLYRRMIFGKPPAKHMRLVDAELAKISLNCAVTMKISFANQVGLVARKLGADPEKVLEAVGADRRIGPLALRAGLPFGGPCFPRDNRMFQHVACLVGERAPLAEATDQMNRRMLRAVLDKVAPHGDVGILGLAYKPGTAVTEDSPGSLWRHTLMSSGRRVKAHDVLAPHDHSVEEVAACPTVIVACAWPEYFSLTFPGKTVLIDPFRATAGHAEPVHSLLATEVA